LYKQIDGVAMGSPLGLLSANVSMGLTENQLEQKSLTPSFYRRYVEDDVDDAQHRISDIFPSSTQQCAT